MQKILILITALVFCNVAWSQNLSGQLEKYLKKKADSVIQVETQKKVDSIKQNETTTNQQPNIIVNNTIINQDTTKQNTPKPQDVTAQNDSTQEKADTIPKMTAVDSLANQKARILTLSTTIDTTAIEQWEWEAKKHINEEKKPEDYYISKYSLAEGKTYKKYHILDSTKKVFGWHPYWMGKAYQNYNYSLLSHLAYFSYMVEPKTGDYQSIHNWHETAVIDSAQKYGNKVLLTITNFGISNNIIFLSNRNNQQEKLINNVITLIQARNADGVCIDFEQVPTKMRNQLTNFVIDMYRSLKKINENYEITMAVPAKDFRQSFDLQSLDPFVNLFVIMGYVYYGKFSKVAGPVAPLRSGDIWWSVNVENTVLDYTVSGVDPSKIILGVPYYGAEWQTKDLTFPSKSINFKDYYTYYQIRRKFPNIRGKIDKHSQSMYHVYRGQDTRYYQLWFEDTASLSQKYDLVKENKLGGIGIWALGYDNGFPDFWQLIAKKFALPPDQMAAVIAAREEKSQRGGVGAKKVMNLLKKMLKNPLAVFKSPGPLVKMLGAMFGVGVVGILLIIKMSKKMKKTVLVGAKGGLIGLFFAMIFVVIYMLKFIGKNELIFLAVGFFVGCILLFLLTYKYIMRDRDLP